MIELLLIGALQCPPSPWLTPELEKHTVPGFGCDSRMFNVIDNAMYSASEYYWAAIDGHLDGTVSLCKEPAASHCDRAPCGGEANCSMPYLADTAICWVEQTDCWEYLDSQPEGTPFEEPIILRTFVLECSGTINCKWEAGLPADFCCKLLEVIEEPTLGNNSC